MRRGYIAVDTSMYRDEVERLAGHGYSVSKETEDRTEMKCGEDEAVVFESMEAALQK